jgi:hypothetical protein
MSRSGNIVPLCVELKSFTSVTDIVSVIFFYFGNPLVFFFGTRRLFFYILCKNFFSGSPKKRALFFWATPKKISSVRVKNELLEKKVGKKIIRLKFRGP